MIDFRYHVVSLISVFLALAVGIVLGAGPLRGNLGTQLTGQVETLREEKEALRGENDTLGRSNDELAAYVSETGSTLVGGTMPGERTAVIYDDNSARTQVDEIDGLLEDAQADLAVRVRLEQDLWDPEDQSVRADAIEQLQGIAPEVVSAQTEDSPSDAATIAGVVSTLLVDEGLDSSSREQLWTVLTDSGLVSTDGDPADAVGSVVFAGADPQELTPTDADTDPDAAAQSAQSLLEVQAQSLLSLADSGVPTVVAGTTPDNDDATGLLRVVRGDNRFEDLSTTDRLQQPDGPVLAVLALVEQLRGGAGNYGTASDAEARVPEVSPGPAVADPQETTAPEDAGSDQGTSDVSDGGAG